MISESALSTVSALDFMLVSCIFCEYHNINVRLKHYTLTWGQIEFVILGINVKNITGINNDGLDKIT